MIVKKTTITEFEHKIDMTNIVYGLLLPFIPIGIVSTLMLVFVPTYLQPGSKPLYGLVMVVTSLVLVYHLRHAKTMTMGQLRSIYIYYHVALFVLCVFVTPYLTPFDALWVILAISMDLLFRKKWAWLTVGAYCLFVGFALVRSPDPFTAEVFLTGLLRIIGFSAVVGLASRLRHILDEERIALAQSFEQKDLERQRLLSLINNMGEAVVAVDKAGNILLYNSALLLMLNTHERLQGKKIADLFHLKNSNGRATSFTDIIGDLKQEVVTRDYTHQANDKEQVNLFISAAPVRLGYRQHAEEGSIIVLRDITKEKSLEDARSEFVNVVSHELRTPLAISEGSIANALLLAEKNDVDTKLAENLKNAHKQVLLLAAMVNDISTLNSAEHNEQDTQTHNVDISQLTQSIMNDAKADISAKNLQVNVQTSGDDAVIASVEMYVREIIQNLISNAIKYTPAGSINISISGNENKVIFTVHDSGIGISHSDQAHIFEKFYRSEDYRTRETGGTGLGLFIVQQLTHKIQATISVESELGKGSLFTVVFPRNINS